MPQLHALKALSLGCPRFVLRPFVFICSQRGCQEMDLDAFDLSDHKLWDAIWTAADPAAGVDLKTPPQKLLNRALSVEALTPEAIPLPCSKIQLQAAKRLEQRLEQAGKENGKSKKLDGKGEECVEGGGSQGRRKKLDGKGEECVEGGGSQGKGKKRDGKGAKCVGGGGTAAIKPKGRKPNDGPLGKAMKAFVDDMKSAGCSHQGALALWKDSDERMEIVNQLSDSERKRRRF